MSDAVLINSGHSTAVFVGTPDAANASASAASALASKNAAATSETNAAASAATALTAASAGTTPVLDLPYAPADGYRVLSGATGEQITWSASKSIWQAQDGKPFATILARFDGSSGQGLDNGYQVDYWRASRDFATGMGFQRFSSTSWIQCDGAGGASPIADTATNILWLDGAMVIPAGCSDWEGYIDVIPGSDTAGSPWLFRSDAKNSSGVRINGATGAIEIVDHIYNNNISATPFIRQSALIPGYSSAAQYRIFVRFNGNEVTAYEPSSGITIKAGSAVSSSFLAGIHSRRHTTTFKEMAVHPRDVLGYKQIGAMRFLGSQGIHADPQGGMFNGLDFPDHALVVFGTEANNTGTVPGPWALSLGRIDRATGAFTYLCQIDANIDQTTGNRVSGGVEGISLFLIAGVPHVMIADRIGGATEPVWLYRCPNPSDLTVGNWPRGQLNLGAQQVFNHETIVPLDLGDGVTRLLVTYQGKTGGTGVGADAGGILELKYSGNGNTLLQSSWTLIQLAVCAGAWGIAGRGPTARIVDLWGTGARNIVFGSRLDSRNVGGTGGAFWIDLDEGGGPDVPNKTVHQIGVAGDDVTMLDYVDLGSGHGLDVATSASASTASADNTTNGTIRFLTNPRSSVGAWTNAAFTVPIGSNPYAWNLWNSGHKRNSRSIILAVLAGTTDPIGGLFAISWNGASYDFDRLHKMPVGHTFEKPFLFKFEMTNGLYYWMGGDDTANHERAFIFFQEWAKLPVASAAAPAAFQTETNTLIAAMTPTPDATHQAAIDRLIARLKNCGAWSSIDVLYVLAAQASQHALLNWKSPATYTAVPANAPTFTADKGYTFNGTSNYLDTTYDPSVASLGYALNSAHIGVFGLTATNGAGPDLGTVNNRTQLRVLGTSGYSYAVNITVGGSTTGSPAPVIQCPMHVAVVRSASNVVKSYLNGKLNQTGSTASNGISSRFYIGSNGTTFSPRQIGAVHVGSAFVANVSPAFTADQVAQEVSLALQEYMGTVGVLG